MQNKNGVVDKSSNNRKRRPLIHTNDSIPVILTYSHQKLYHGDKGVGFD